jgi:hypothetical protein
VRPTVVPVPDRQANVVVVATVSTGRSATAVSASVLVAATPVLVAARPGLVVRLWPVR